LKDWPEKAHPNLRLLVLRRYTRAHLELLTPVLSKWSQTIAVNQLIVVIEWTDPSRLTSNLLETGLFATNDITTDHENKVGNGPSSSLSSSRIMAMVWPWMKTASQVLRDEIKAKDEKRVKRKIDLAAAALNPGTTVITTSKPVADTKAKESKAAATPSVISIYDVILRSAATERTNYIHHPLPPKLDSSTNQSNGFIDREVHYGEVLLTPTATSSIASSLSTPILPQEIVQLVEIGITLVLTHDTTRNGYASTLDPSEIKLITSSSSSSSLASIPSTPRCEHDHCCCNVRASDWHLSSSTSRPVV
jgi:hypothetical protein